MASEPHPANAEPSIQREQFHPELTMLQSRATPVPPSLPLPTEDKGSHPIDQVFGIGVQFDLRAVRKRPERLNRRDQFHFRDSGPGRCSAHFPPLTSLHQNRSPASGSGITDGRAVSKNAI